MQALVPDGYHSITVLVALKLMLPLFSATCSIRLMAVLESKGLILLLSSGSNDFEANAIRYPCNVRGDDAIIKHNADTAASLLNIMGIHPLTKSSFT